MSTLAIDNITNRAGTGGPTLPNGLTIGSAPMPAVTGSAPIYACRAWVNFNGTGTVAIRASYNVSSITDNGVGDYTVNFTTALADANYSAVLGTNGNNAGFTGQVAPRVSFTGAFLTSSVKVFTGYQRGDVTASSAEDFNYVSLAIFR